METTMTLPVQIEWLGSAPRISKPEYISTSEAARRMGVSTSTIRRWIQRGYLDATRTSAGYRVAANDLEAAKAAAGSRRPGSQVDTIVSERPTVTVRTSEQGQPTVTATRLTPAGRRVASRVDRARVLEGLQRSIILEQAKYQRAARRKDAMAMRDCAWRLDTLYQQLEEVQDEERRRQRQERESHDLRERLHALRDHPGVAALVSSTPIMKASPSRRMFNVATILILNGFLMMLMTFVA